MTVLFLQVTRQFIITWVTLSVMPIETVFDAIETELVRRGVNPNL